MDDDNTKYGTQLSVCSLPGLFLWFWNSFGQKYLKTNESVGVQSQGSTKLFGGRFTGKKWLRAEEPLWIETSRAPHLDLSCPLGPLLPTWTSPLPRYIRWLNLTSLLAVFFARSGAPNLFGEPTANSGTARGRIEHWTWWRSVEGGESGQS